MGTTYVQAMASGPTGIQSTIRFLIDSGATYTVLPFDEWRKLGLSPKRAQTFQLADGTTLERQISECHLTLPQGETSTPVVLGEPGDHALLGVVTLEELGLVLNPFRRTLEPMQAMLA